MSLSFQRPSRGLLLQAVLAGALVSCAQHRLQAADAIRFDTVNAIFSDQCTDCHGGKDPEGKFELEDYAGLMKGGESGAAIIPGKSEDSLLVRMIEGKLVKDGEKKIMPPGKRKKLDTAQIAMIRAWIDAGAKGPDVGQVAQARELNVPKILPTVPPRLPVTALAYDARRRIVAAVLGREIVLRGETGTVRQTLVSKRGQINAVEFSPDGKIIYGAGGQPALFGEIYAWKTADGSVLRVSQGHKDAIYSMALSPGGHMLATGSYDQTIRLWDAETGKEIRVLTGHNGAVFGLAFRPDGKVLASASADRTVKLWEVESGKRLDTLSQSLRELYAVAFSPDGKRLVAGGVDNRIRVWSISETAAETTNPLLESKFAHEGAILNLVFSDDGGMLVSSAEDKTVKVWDGRSMTERFLLEAQPDWAQSLAFIDGGAGILVGRMDGSIGVYDAKTGKAGKSFAGSWLSAPAVAAREGIR